MSNSLRQEFHSNLAQTIANEILYKRSNYYYFLGKPETWGTSDIAPPVIEVDSNTENNKIRSNIVYVKKITSNDVSLVTKRYDWATGIIFDKWDSTKDMYQKMFYCVNSESNVYKCLDNSGTTASTVEPTGKSFYVFRTADGYLWKYMYTVPTFKRSRFMNLVNLPVQRSITDSFYNKGSVDDVVVTNPGTGYSDALLTSLTVAANTFSGSGATATITCNGFGAVTSIVINNGGSGYTAGCSIAISSLGAGFVGTPVIVAGVITGVTIVQPGLGYTTGQTMTFPVGGAVIIPSVSRTTGAIVSTTIVNPGAGYVTAPVITVNGAGGSGVYGSASAVVTCVVFEGKIVKVNIQDPGQNYPSDNATTIVVQGDGFGAVFSPIIYNTEILDVVVENPGSGYTSMKITVAGTGIGAAISPIISASDFSSEQSIVEQTTSPGTIFAAEVMVGGNYYTTTTVVNITGDGTGAIATPVVENGVITKIIMTSYGSDYSYANITFTDVNRPIAQDAVTATAYAIISPSTGHGWDAITELYGDVLAIATSLQQDDNLNIINQDYRQYGVLKNPTDVLTGKTVTLDSSLTLYKVVMTDITGLVADEILVQGTSKYRVVHFMNNEVYLQRLGIKYTNPVGSLYAETENSRTYSVTSLLSSPTVNKFSGSLLYVSDENPFTFNPEQGLVIKTFINF
jgi:hypothetical protein